MRKKKKQVGTPRSRGERNMVNVSSAIRDSLVEKVTFESSLEAVKEEARSMSRKSIPGRGESECKCPGARGVWVLAGQQDSVQLGRGGRRGEVREVMKSQRAGRLLGL